MRRIDAARTALGPSAYLPAGRACTCFECDVEFWTSAPTIICEGCAAKRISRYDRRRDVSEYKQYVYGLYRESILVYIGVTKRPVARLQNHILTKDFTDMVVVKGFSTREKAERFEEVAIYLHRPPLNIARPDDAPQVSNKLYAKDLLRFTTWPGKVV